MPKETHPNIIELLEKYGGRIAVSPTGVPVIGKVDLTKVRYLANFSNRSIILSDLNITLRPGEIIDLYKVVADKNKIPEYRAIRDALLLDTPLLNAYEDTDEGRAALEKDASEYSHIPSPLDKAKEEVGGAFNVTQPEEAVLGSNYVNPYQDELDKIIEESREGYTIGESSKPKGRKRRKTSEE